MASGIVGNVGKEGECMELNELFKAVYCEFGEIHLVTLFLSTTVQLTFNPISKFHGSHSD